MEKKLTHRQAKRILVCQCIDVYILWKCKSGIGSSHASCTCASMSFHTWWCVGRPLVALLWYSYGVRFFPGTMNTINFQNRATKCNRKPEFDLRMRLANGFQNISKCLISSWHASSHGQKNNNKMELWAFSPNRSQLPFLLKVIIWLS